MVSCLQWGELKSASVANRHEEATFAWLDDNRRLISQSGVAVQLLAVYDVFKSVHD